MITNKNVDTDFLISALKLEGSFKTTAEVMEWVKRLNELTFVSIKKTTFSNLTKWKFDDVKKNISHDSGKFFSIDGVRITTNHGIIGTWEQPIINQPEIGYLGFIVKEFDGVLHFLVQGKIEPGNVNIVQISPTLQATKSNYTQVHNGKKPNYLDYFQNVKPENILLDQLQSEQGARFLRKRNRNIIIRVEEDIIVHDNFTWITLGQIKKLMAIDNLVNMDTRTVISGISFPTVENTEVFNYSIATNNFFKSATDKSYSLNTLDKLISFLTNLKSTYDLNIVQKDLKELKGWNYTDEEIYHTENKYFKVIPAEIQIEGREVSSWCQPLIEPAQEGLCAFICKEINGVLHFIVQAKLECGNHDIIEFAPTVQCLTGNYRDTKKGTLPFLDYVLTASKEKIVFDTIQSEEGGRFFKEQNRNILIIAGDDISEVLPDRYVWMTLNQIFLFLKFNNFFNIQARSLIAAISFTNGEN